MNPIRTSFLQRLGPQLVRGLFASLLLVLIAGCGGGVGSGGTGTYAAGPITGFGSIIVNGVRFDESSAVVLDDDDATRSRSELKLGMTVEVDSDAIRSDTSGRMATASRVRFGSAIVGPVAGVNVAAGTVSVLGQTVKIAVDTVFDERITGGLAGLGVGQVVEVYALYDAANARYNATRVEPRSTPAQWTLRGPVAAVDPVAHTLKVGGALFNYATATGVPSDLAVASIVRLRLNTTADAGGRYAVASFGAGLRNPGDRDEGELEGLITGFVSSVSFQVNGLAVDAASASFPAGKTGLRLGARVDVKGTLRAGVLVATSVAVETEASVDDRGFEIHGAIATVDAAARTFTLSGQTIGWTRSDLVLEGGTLADIAVGRIVEVNARPNADRTRLDATKIQFEH